MGYYLPFGPEIKLGQPFGSNPGLGPNPSGGHNGDDWLTWVGVPVRAAGDGEVIFAGQFDSTYEDNFGWNLHYGGNMVVLNMDGAAGPYFEYGHLSRILVRNGQRVKAGDIIAYTGNTDGNTGVSTGPHCHVGCLPPNFNLNSNTYGRVNPRLYMTRYWDAGAGTISAQSATITPAAGQAQAVQPKEWDEMATKQEIFEAVWGGPGVPMIYNNMLDRNEYPSTVLGALQDRVVRQQLVPLRHEVAAQAAQVASLIGAVAALSKGEAFDEAKLLAGVQAAAAAGVKSAIDSIETTTIVTVKEG